VLCSSPRVSRSCLCMCRCTAAHGVVLWCAVYGCALLSVSRAFVFLHVQASCSTWGLCCGVQFMVAFSFLFVFWPGRNHELLGGRVAGTTQFHSPDSMSTVQTRVQLVVHQQRSRIRPFIEQPLIDLKGGGGKKRVVIKKFRSISLCEFGNHACNSACRQDWFSSFWSRLVRLLTQRRR
jgi:hypothetical protein